MEIINKYLVKELYNEPLIKECGYERAWRQKNAAKPDKNRKKRYKRRTKRRRKSNGGGRNEYNN